MPNIPSDPEGSLGCSNPAKSICGTKFDQMWNVTPGAAVLKCSKPALSHISSTRTAALESARNVQCCAASVHHEAAWQVLAQPDGGRRKKIIPRTFTGQNIYTLIFVIFVILHILRWIRRAPDPILRALNVFKCYE